MLLSLVVVAAGIFLTRAADAIAEITRLGRLLVGSILLAAATSLPELTVDISAVRAGLPNLAAGDLLGSSLMNLLILAIADLATRSRGGMLSREAAGHALSGALAVTLTALVGLALFVSKRLPDPSFCEVSAPVWAILAGYVLGVRTVFLDQRVSARAAAEAAKELPGASDRPSQRRSLWRALGEFAIATTALFLAGPRMAVAAGEIADATGLGATFIGTTLVAFCTSLPELVSTLAAVRMRAFDLAIGNILGSNAFNMILFVPLDYMHGGPLFAALAESHAISCLAAVVATSIVVMGQLYQVNERWRLIEPDALLVVSIILGSLWLVYHLG